MSASKKPDLSTRTGRNKIAFQGGTYSLAVSAIVLAILIAVNVLVSVLPASSTQLDISATQLYSITSNTKAVLSQLSKDVNLYWIVQADQEDDIVSNLLSRYDSLSPNIHVVKRNPDVYPTFAAQYTDEDVANNSLIVECGSRSRYIPYEDIYVTSTDYYGRTYVSAFDGESVITSAIHYVVSDDLPVVYQLQGHGEGDLPESFQGQLDKENIELQTLSLLTADTVPEDADAVMIYAPETDISEEEKDMLADYAKAGGKLLVMAGPVEDGALTNLYALLGDYGVTAADGIAVEEDRSHYAFQEPYILLPDIASADLTDPLIAEHYYVIMPLSLGLDLTNAASGVTSLLTTSDTAFSKTAGFGFTTYDKEDGDIDGPFSLAVSIDCGSDGRIIWFASSDFLSDIFNSYSSGANGDLTVNALSALIGQQETLAIRSKSLTNQNYLTISDSTASMLKVLMIGVFPIAFLGIGIAIAVQRRRLANEAAN